MRIFVIVLFLLLLWSCKEDQVEIACIDESRIDTESACIMIYDPVCGCNNMTYGNECVATNAGLTSWTAGACGAKTSE